MSEPVEQYLDEMFDRLAGTGPAGRRALTETEDHLRAAVQDGLASGLSQPEAELEAVHRFGPVAVVAGQLRQTHRRRIALSMLSGGWLLAGLVVTGIGATYLLASLDMTTLHPVGPYSCQVVQAGGVAVPCPGYDSLAGSAVLAGLVTLLLGAAILIGRAVTLRRTGLPVATRRFPAVAAALLVVAGVLFVGWPDTNLVFARWQGPGPRIAGIAAIVAVLTAIGVAAWGLVRTRRSRRDAVPAATVH